MIKKERGPRVARSIQTWLALGYIVIIAALLILMNTYPLLMTQNVMFHTKETALKKQTLLITGTLNTADGLTEESVEQALSGLEDLDVTRILVTDMAGLILYDSAETSTTGQYALTGEIVSALRGNDTFGCSYQKGAFLSRAASPVMVRNNVVGAVCLYEQDSNQGVLLEEIQNNLRIVSVVVCVAVAALLAVFSNLLARRIGKMLGGIRMVRAGEYTHRIPITGRDELAQLADEFNQLTLRLQTTEEERRQFVSDASHELKTPLASIRLLTDSILQDENMDRETTREFVGDIGEATDRLIHISEELLSLNRADENKQVRRVPVDTARMAERTSRMLQPLAQANQIEMNLQLEEGCVVRCNEDDMVQILRNLMENAIKYNYPEGQVTVTVKQSADQGLIVVADTGIGIPAEDLPRIFDRFYRVEKARSRQAGGTGLGLSIVRDTVLLHGGSIQVNSQAEGGTQMEVRIPLWREETME